MEHDLCQPPLTLNGQRKRLLLREEAPRGLLGNSSPGTLTRMHFVCYTRPPTDPIAPYPMCIYIVPRILSFALHCPPTTIYANPILDVGKPKECRMQDIANNSLHRYIHSPLSESSHMKKSLIFCAVDSHIMQIRWIILYIQSITKMFHLFDEVVHMSFWHSMIN